MAVTPNCLLAEHFVADTARVAAILPVSGGVDGGTIVTVSGENYYATAVCKFGTLAAVSATADTSSMLRCVSPATSAGAVLLEISNNNQDFTENAQRYTYYSMPAVSAIEPVNGPFSGGTVVTVYGSSFVSSGAFRCKFHDLSAVEATFVTSSVVLCVSPANTTATGVLEVSNNNQDYTTNATPFTYYGAYVM